MEMYQVRYFLSVARALNLTRAAQECDVAQPSLSRAIKQLEAELGGELFHRERPQAILTELGQRMLPILTRCYESANSARALAAAVKKGEAGALHLALSRTIELALLLPHLHELNKLFDGLSMSVRRGSPAEALDYLKSGDAEVGIVAAKSEKAQALESWPPFEEDFIVSAAQIITWRRARLSALKIYTPSGSFSLVIANTLTCLFRFSVKERCPSSVAMRRIRTTIW